MGATDLVLRMAEAGTVVLPGLVPDKVVRVIGEVSRDIPGRSRVGLAGGRQLSALDIQREYLTGATYHGISRDRGLYCRLQRSGAVERTARDIDVFEAKTVPPARAATGRRADPAPAWPPRPCP